MLDIEDTSQNWTDSHLARTKVFHFVLVPFLEFMFRDQDVTNVSKNTAQCS